MASIEPFIHRKIVLLNQNTSARDAACAMRDNQIGCILVGDSRGQLVGIVTDRDFACRLAAEFADGDITLSRFMTQDPITTSEDSRLVDVLNLMENHGVRRIPIMAQNTKKISKCIGIITLDDLIASGCVHQSQLARIIQRQVGRRIISGVIRWPNALAREGRIEANARQTLDKFHKRLVERTGLTAEMVPDVTLFLLGSIVMRITYTAAMHFIAQLPKLLHEPLFRLPSGPNRKITLDRLCEEMVTRFRFTDEQSRTILHQFFAALDDLVGEGQARHLGAQLPQEMREELKAAA